MSGDAEQFDVAIVGARCAGSPLATMLARRGLRVCLLDRARFPSETPSTHVIQPCGVAILREFDLEDEIFEAGAVPLTKVTQVSEDVRVDAEFEVESFGGPGLCLRRIVLDEVLVKAAAAAGAVVRTGTAVGGLRQEGGRVSGVETEQGPIRARLVVGADGRRSTVAGLVGAGEYWAEPPSRLFAWGYFEAGEAEGRIRLGRKGGLSLLGCPTDSGLYMAAVCPYLTDKEAFLADREGGLIAGLATWPELADQVAGATRVGPVRVMANWHGYFRQAAGPGWALLGDAGHFKDPTPAQGISDALRQGKELASAIEAGLGGGAAGLDAELARWWRWRDEDAREMHWFATDMGTGTSRLLGHQILKEISNDEEAAEGLLRVLNHELLPSELFTARLVGRAIAHAFRERPDQIPAVSGEIAAELGNLVRRSWIGRRPRRRSLS